jgi:hypothetical protein
VTRLCSETYRGEPCRNEPRVSPMGTVHAFCPRCEARLMRDAFGHSWVERATSETLPSLCVGGVPVPASGGPLLSRRGVVPPAAASPAQQAASKAPAGMGAR